MRYPGPVLVVPLWPAVFCLIAGAVLSAMFFGPLPIVVALAGAALTAVMLASLQKTLASAC
jgi:hypothetical protein